MSSLSPQVLRFSPLIQEASQATGLPFNLIASLVQQESSGNPRAQSGAGAQGLTQLMPATAASLGVTDPFDPRQSIFGGSRFLRQQIDSFGSVGLGLAAFNAGPGAVRRAGGIPNFTETQNFVNQVSSRAGISPDVGLSGLQGSIQPPTGGVASTGTQSPQIALQQAQGVGVPSLVPQIGATQQANIGPRPTALSPPEERTPQIQTLQEPVVNEQSTAQRAMPTVNLQQAQPVDVASLQAPPPPRSAAEGIERLGAQQEQVSAQIAAGAVTPTNSSSTTPGAAGAGIGVIPSQPGQFGSEADRTAAAPLFNKEQAGWQNLVNFSAQFGGNIQGDFQTTGGVHAPGSLHYAGRAIDLGDATVSQSAFASIGTFARRNPWLFKELYYGPQGWFIKNGQVFNGDIGGHGNHMHIAV